MHVKLGGSQYAISTRSIAKHRDSDRGQNIDSIGTILVSGQMVGQIFLYHDTRVRII
jgi:hypothetical protein